MTAPEIDPEVLVPICEPDRKPETNTTDWLDRPWDSSGSGRIGRGSFVPGCRAGLDRLGAGARARPRSRRQTGIAARHG